MTETTLLKRSFHSLGTKTFFLWLEGAEFGGRHAGIMYFNGKKVLEYNTGLVVVDEVKVTMRMMWSVNEQK